MITVRLYGCTCTCIRLGRPALHRSQHAVLGSDSTQRGDESCYVKVQVVLFHAVRFSSRSSKSISPILASAGSGSKRMPRAARSSLPKRLHAVCAVRQPARDPSWPGFAPGDRLVDPCDAEALHRCRRRGEARRPNRSALQSLNACQLRFQPQTTPTSPDSNCCMTVFITTRALWSASVTAPVPSV